MKKENRKLAQERRAAERRRLEKKKKRKHILLTAVPVFIILLLIFVIVRDNIRRQDSSTDTSAFDGSVTETSATPGPTETLSLQTDPSLTVEDGDTINIDYVGTVDGTEFAGGSTDGLGTNLVIGSETYIDDFEDQLVGTHPGDKVKVTVTFPEDYGAENLNGKEAVFDVTVNGIYR